MADLGHFDDSFRCLVSIKVRIHILLHGSLPVDNRDAHYLGVGERGPGLANAQQSPIFLPSDSWTLVQLYHPVLVQLVLKSL